MGEIQKKENTHQSAAQFAVDFVSGVIAYRFRIGVGATEPSIAHADSRTGSDCDYRFFCEYAH